MDTSGRQSCCTGLPEKAILASACSANWGCRRSISSRPAPANAKSGTSLTAMLLWFWASWLLSRKQSKRRHESMKAKSKSVSSQPALAVDSEVVRTIRQHARSCHKTEVCGVLIGQDRDHRIEVSACIEGQNAEEAGAHVTFTQDTWEHIYAVKDKKFPNERIGGWNHLDPGFGT